MRAQIIVVSGLPASGKSTVAKWLAHRCSQPLLAKDTFKEALFDTLTAGDAAWSKQLSAASYAILFAMAEEMARSGTSCILEGNFRWEQTSEAFQSLAAKAQLRQVWCYASSDVLIQRLRQRAADPNRHPGHRDAEFVPRLLEEVASGPLPLSGPLLELDTRRDRTDFEAALISFLGSS